jgi:hypothetical protein
MKILLSEAQFETLMKELDSRPDGHDIEQREMRLNLLRSGVDVILEYVKHELVQKIGWLPRGNVSKIVGKYHLPDTVADTIKNRLEEIYKYNFPKSFDYSVLIYDFELNSPTVRNEQIEYPEGPAGNKIRDMVQNAFSMKRNDAQMFFTNYEPVDKSNPEGEKSKTDRADCLVLVIRGNVAHTLFLTQTGQWKNNQARVDKVIDYNNFMDHIAKDKEPERKIDYSPLELMRQTLRETSILDWIERK